MKFASHNLRLLATITLLVVSLLGCKSLAGNGEEKQSMNGSHATESVQITGHIEFVPLEGGFWGIIGENGQQYEPASLPKAFQEDELPVRATLRPLTGQVSFRMWGTLVEIVSLERRP